MKLWKKPRLAAGPSWCFLPALHRGEALAAIDRAILPGLEGNLRGAAATDADHFIHLTLAAVAVATVLLTAGGTASRAAAGLILEALVSIELLLRSGENEFRAALTALQGLVFEHGYTLLICVPIRSCL